MTEQNRYISDYFQIMPVETIEAFVNEYERNADQFELAKKYHIQPSEIEYIYLYYKLFDGDITIIRERLLLCDFSLKWLRIAYILKSTDDETLIFYKRAIYRESGSNGITKSELKSKLLLTGKSLHLLGWHIVLCEDGGREGINAHLSKMLATGYKNNFNKWDVI